MPRSDVPPRSSTWARVAVLALVGIATTACSDSARFQSSSYSRAVPPQEVTGSAVTQPTPNGRVVAQPLPTPSRQQTVAASSVSNGTQGLGAYPVTTQRAESAGHWTWDGGSPVTVGAGETVESIARKYGVPASALRQTNNLSETNAIRPGQRIVIPRYLSSSASAQRATKSAHVAQGVHVVAPGETMMGIAHKYGITLNALARANNMQPFGKISVGQPLTIPGSHSVAVAHAPAAPPPSPQVAQPRTIPAEKAIASAAPLQSARVVTPETQTTTQSVTTAAEPAGNLPSFRWPVKGRIIAAFGSKMDGTQNDGINLAVPEGTPVKAADDGVVAYAGNELKGYGNLVLVRHANGYVSAYANASEILVKRGDTIKRGQVIAHAGQTGNVTSPQLHFEIRKGSTPVDPTKYLGGA